MNYDLKAILKKMEEVKPEFSEMCLHGGEPLLMKKEDVRKILTKIKKLTGHSGIQTNGTLIDDDFIKIFKDCSTDVGISYDGPGELSDYRLYSFKNADIEGKIKKMVKAGIKVSLIIVLSKSNAGTKKRLAKLKKFLLDLKEMGLCGRINPCGGWKEYELGEKELAEAYLDLAEFCLKNDLRWSPFIDVINALQGRSRVCAFSGCDPFCTPSAAEMMGDGSLTNCMRLNKESILLRYPRKDNTRNEILAETSQEFGGCKDCKYWSACNGGCPSAAIDGDWRNRTYQCATWKALFAFYDKILSFCNTDVAGHLLRQNANPGKEGSPGGHQDHLDHFDSSGLQPGVGHNDHGDAPHGDWCDSNKKT